MQTEIELKILDINPADMTQKLIGLGAKKLDQKFQKRYVYDVVKGDESQWVRLRDTGKKVELTYKKIENDSITGTQELEIEVSDFASTNEFLEKLGYKAKAYQENKRLSFTLGDLAIEIDEWPLLKPYLEIEGLNETSIYDLVEKLGYTKEQTTSINTKKLYAQNGIGVDTTPELKF